MTSFEYLGPYRLGKPLGRGGMGSVYAAEHAKTGEKVAVKLIAQNVSDEPRFRRRFHAEIETLQRLRHKGIVRPIGVGEEDGLLFYSMELVEGESLQSRIRREKKIDWRPTLDIAIQICAALKHAHDIGVIHRDLKPANLMLTQDETVKLVDFGIAKIFGDGEQTLPGSVLGTADYMAPEQATSTGITPRTDLYALGNVMYSMLTGRPPFTGKRVTEVIESLKRDRPVPLDLVNPDLPEALVELVHHLLEKEPADRPPTALAVMNRLKAMRAGLQKEKTVLTGDSATQADFYGPDSGDTDPSGLHGSDAPTDVSGEKKDAQRKRTIVSKGGSKGPQSDRQDATVVSDISKEKTLRPDGSADETEDPRRHTKTHFQTVSDSRPTSGVFRQDGASDSHWAQWLVIAGMVAVLMVGAALFISAMQPPSADQLYEVAVDGDRGAMKTFLRRFPEDARYTEVLTLHMDGRLNSVLKRLSTRAKLDITRLDAAEAGFMNAMEGREQEPAQSMERLDHWLNVYGGPAEELDPERKELIELAKYERDQLKIRAPKIIVDPQAQELINDILDSVQTLADSPSDDDVQQVRKKLVGIITIHENDDWARPAVDEAKKQLRKIEESLQPEVAKDVKGESTD